MLRAADRFEQKTSWNKRIISVGTRYAAWCLDKGLDAWPIRYHTLSEFIAHYVSKNNQSAKSLQNLISALKCYCVSTNKEWITVQDAYKINRLVKAFEYMDPHDNKIRLPATMDIILKVLDSMNQEVIEDRYFALMMLLMHNGMFRAGELFKGIKVRDIEWNEESQEVTFIIRRSKKNRKGRAERVTLRNYGDFSGYAALRAWFEEHNLWSDVDKYVFPYIERKRKNQPTRLNFNKNASYSRWEKDITRYFDAAQLPGNNYTGHSFRAGGATDLFLVNTSYPTIKKVGRWKSDSAMDYFKGDDQIAKVAARGFKKCYDQAIIRQRTRRYKYGGMKSI